MAIPKKIHYCWFGSNPLPGTVKKCIKTWKKYCPDYEIIRWDESNFDFTDNAYAQQAYKANKLAFVSDYARLKIVYEQGGIYLDTDVELIKPIDDIVEKYEAYFGYEYDNKIATGLGFGAEKGNKFVWAMLKSYDGISFIDNKGEPDLTACPVRNTEALVKMGLDTSKSEQIIDNACFFPCEVMAPLDYQTQKKCITERTISIHHYDGSWCSDVTKRTTRLKKIIGIRCYDFLYAKLLNKSKRWEW